MKNIAFFFLFLSGLFSASCPALAQAGGVFTVAGGGTSTADGVPATNASFISTTGVATDGAGNIYVADRMRYVIKKIDGVTGMIHNIAGTSGTPGFAGDGGPATAAVLSTNIGGIQVTSTGDVYFSDHDRVRKISAVTGNITTVAGGGSSTADGVPATNAALLIMNNMYVSNVGDIYVNCNHRIKKVDAVTGIITTIAGGGTSFADGIPATDASMPDTAKSISMDNAGNLYILSGNILADKIRKIDAASGLIHTVAGGGSSLSDGIPATNMKLSDTWSCSVDGGGNIFIADWGRHLILRVDASTGLVNTIAGATSGGDTAEGTSAFAALVKPYMLCLNTTSSTVYFSDLSTKVKRFAYSPMVMLSGGSSIGIYSSDSMYVSINKKCSGPDFTVHTRHFHSGMTIRTYFGDGTGDTANVGPSWSNIGGYMLTGATYPTSGTYTVTHVLCNYGVPVDTLSYVYNHAFCSQMSVYYYNDEDLNCLKGASEHFAMKSIVTQIDSNGVPIDTIVATSGFTYMAYGIPGDIYTFKVLSAPFGLVSSCPSTGILYDSLVAGLTENPALYAAFSCIAPATADLTVSAHIVATGPNDQSGHIYVYNNHCLPVDATVTLNYSPKYLTFASTPLPVSYTENSITWNLIGLSNTDNSPHDLFFTVWHNPAYPYPVDGDTVNEMITVTPLGGVTDVHTANNMIIRTDTVRTSCDPNEIVVSPSCFDNDTTFHFTVHFENIGSAPAENIYVMDTLSPWFDASTMDIEMSTHTMFTSKQVANGLTIYRFDFPNINLADSSDHANRDGAFMYTIKNKPGIPTGIIARSRVGIYFDYNDVLLTNTVENRKGCPTTTGIADAGTKGNSIAIYPNPTSGNLTIDMGNNSYGSLSVTNAVGQVLLQQAVANPQLTIDVRHLPAGIYYVALRGSMGTEVRKFVKW